MPGVGCGVETEAALVRCKADSQAWQVWRELQSQFHLLVLDPKEEALLRAFNRSLGLRAADAGHLFVFDRLLAADPEADLLTYDQEVYDAALRLGLPVLNFQE